MNAKELWNKFIEENNINDTYYEAWAFGDNPDKLLKLVLEGRKTATASLNYWYKEKGERRPEPGDYSVILDSKGDAYCVIQTVKVYIKPFKEVSAEHAFKEGEGDLSLAYWRKVHEEFFRDELKDEELKFSEDLEVVLEEFELKYILK